MRTQEAIALGSLEVVAGPAEHRGRPALSWRVSAGGEQLVYTGDTSFCDELALFARGARLLVSECSFPDGSAVDGHMTPEAVGRLASIAQVGQVLLVHLYPVFGEADPAAAVRRTFAGAVRIAHDGMIVDL
jgi:ribonuclease BN (tRNA processing enzyme)